MAAHRSIASVHAVVVTHNSEHTLAACLQSLARCEPALAHIWVVDNASSDNTPHLVGEFVNKGFGAGTDLPVTLLPQRENLGFARANNIGMRHALLQGAQHVFLLNDDATTHPHAPGLLASAQRQYPRFGVLSPVHYAGEASDQVGAQALRSTLSKPSHAGGPDGDSGAAPSHEPDACIYDAQFLKNVVCHKDNEALRKALAGSIHPSKTLSHTRPVHTGDAGVDASADPIHLTEPVQVPFVNAAAWMLSRACLHAIGGFYPGFFMYGEDDEFLQRARHNGFKVGICVQAAMWHHRSLRVDTGRQRPNAGTDSTGVLASQPAHSLQDRQYALNITRVIQLDEGRSPGQKTTQLARLYGQLIRRGLRHGDLRQWALVGQSCALAWRLRSTRAQTEAYNDLWGPSLQSETQGYG